MCSNSQLIWSYKFELKIVNFERLLHLLNITLFLHFKNQLSPKENLFYNQCSVALFWLTRKRLLQAITWLVNLRGIGICFLLTNQVLAEIFFSCQSKLCNTHSLVLFFDNHWHYVIKSDCFNFLKPSCCKKWQKLVLGIRDVWRFRMIPNWP